MGGITFYHEKNQLSPSFGLSLASPFFSPLGWLWPSFFCWLFVLLVFYTCEFLSNFDLENVIVTYRKPFS
jgi:hypothetical protein